MSTRFAMVPVSLHAEQTDQRVRWQWVRLSGRADTLRSGAGRSGEPKPRCQPRAAEDNLEMINEQR